MKICKEHWARLRQGVDDRGMTQLVGNAESAYEELQGEPKEFNPLLHARYYIWTAGLEHLGLGVMVLDTSPGAPNDGHVCPLCEARKSFDAHKSPSGRCSDPTCTVQVAPGDKPWDEVLMFDQCLDPMRKYCLEQGLIPQLS
jgi:hypothetical protein